MTRKESFLELNRERANRGSEMLDEYRHAHCEWEEDQTVLTDILADIMHMSSQQFATHFDEALEMAREHFKAEMTGED